MTHTQPIVPFVLINVFLVCMDLHHQEAFVFVVINYIQMYPYGLSTTTRCRIHQINMNILYHIMLMCKEKAIPYTEYYNINGILQSVFTYDLKSLKV
jgi:hypothetical protein